MAIEYRLSVGQPHTHLVEVEIRVEAAGGPIDLVMPSWTPGSYLIREFPRNVQDFEAHDSTGLRLASGKIDKNTWRLEGDGVGAVTARYRVYANELSVRTSHVDASHAFINGASVFMFVRGMEREEARLRIAAPEGWRVSTSLHEWEDGLLVAKDYDELVDSPIEIGDHRTIVWEQEGIDHRYAIWGAKGVDEDRLVTDTRRIIEVCSTMFGGLPYDRYLFILHVFPEGRGGLEHKNSCALHVLPSWLYGDDYENLIALVAHEFFHVWLVKRIRPAPLGPFDYVRENYTRNLWVVEGFTTYYTDLILLRAGVMTEERYLERLGDSIARLQALPGRHHQSLEDSSFDAWIKFYRPDAHSPNSQVSYYHKGSLVALAVDLEIRRATSGERSLDDVMRVLWERYGERDIGFPEEREAGIQAVVEEVGGSEVGALLAEYVTGTGEIDFDRHLEAAGMKLLGEGASTANASGAVEGKAAAESEERSENKTARVGSPKTRTPPPPTYELRLGLRLRDESGRIKVTSLLEGSPAGEAGVNAGDELVVLAGERATLQSLAQIAKSAEAGEIVEVLVVRRNQALTLSLHVGPATERQATISAMEGATDESLAVRRGWLKTEISGANPTS